MAHQTCDRIPLFSSHKKLAAALMTSPVPSKESPSRRPAAILSPDAAVKEAMQAVLESADYDCTFFPEVDEMVREVTRHRHELILVDLDAPGEQADDLMRWRANWMNPEATVIAIGSDDKALTASALEQGVDDFVLKPLRAAELLARLAVASRRRRPAGPAELLVLGPCRLDRGLSAIVCGAQQVALTARELAVAQVLFDSPGRPVSRERLAREVWGLDAQLTSRSIDQHIYQLRRKLKLCAGSSIVLRCVYSRGYRIDVVTEV